MKELRMFLPALALSVASFTLGILVTNWAHKRDLAKIQAEPDCPDPAPAIFARIRSEVADGEWKGQPLVGAAAFGITTEELYERACLPAPRPYAARTRAQLSPTVCADGEPPAIHARLSLNNALEFDCEPKRNQSGSVNKIDDGRMALVQDSLFRVQFSAGKYQVFSGNWLRSENDRADWYSYAEGLR